MNQPQQDIPTSASEFETSLKAFRAQIDAIDEELISLICKRSNIVSQVGKLKERQQVNVSPMRPAREASQLKKMSERFKEEAFPEAAAVHIWRHIINGSLAIEGVFSIGVYGGLAGTSELAWLAREYFGAYSQITRENQALVLVGKVKQDVCNIAVLPYPDAEEKNPWWLDLISDAEDAPSIFLKLPYLPQMVNKSPSQQVVQAFAIAKVAEEDFGEDGLTAIAMVTETHCSMSKLQEAFKHAGLDAQWLAVVPMGEIQRAHFVEVKGSFGRRADILAKIGESLKESLLNIGIIGRYAAAI